MQDVTFRRFLLLARVQMTSSSSCLVYNSLIDSQYRALK